MLSLLLAVWLFGASVDTVIFVNHTGLKIARIEIGNKKYEDVSGKEERILIQVSAQKHHLRLVFRGGAQIDWPDFDFKGVHQITFELVKNRVNAKYE